MEHKTKAWIVTGLLLLALLAWALVAVHDSAVASARAARANKSGEDTSQGGCPFSNGSTTAAPQEMKKKSCCHSKKSASENENVEEEKNSNKFKAAKSLKAKEVEKSEDELMEEMMKQFTPEQLAKCPHLKARKTNKKKA